MPPPQRGHAAIIREERHGKDQSEGTNDNEKDGASGSASQDGAAAGNTRAIEDSKRMQRIDELFNILKNKRELWKQLHPGKDFPGVVILQVDQDVQAVVVKSVFQTAAFAGFPNVSFMVGAIPKSHNN